LVFEKGSSFGRRENDASKGRSQAEVYPQFEPKGWSHPESIAF
jgi:hypothetical protein